MLLDRLAALGGTGQSRYHPTTEQDIDALISSVQRNLQRVLNARHGMSEALGDYGLPALTDLIVGSADYVEAVSASIKTAVTKYEPRLRNVRVSRIADEEHTQLLAFRVDAVLVSDSGEHKIWYETEIAATGEYRVSE